MFRNNLTPEVRVKAAYRDRCNFWTSLILFAFCILPFLLNSLVLISHGQSPNTLPEDYNTTIIEDYDLDNNPDNLNNHIRIFTLFVCWSLGIVSAIDIIEEGLKCPSKEFEEILKDKKT